MTQSFIEKNPRSVLFLLMLIIVYYCFLNVFIAFNCVIKMAEEQDHIRCYFGFETYWCFSFVTINNKHFESAPLKRIFIWTAPAPSKGRGFMRVYTARSGSLHIGSFPSLVRWLMHLERSAWRAFQEWFAAALIFKSYAGNVCRPTSGRLRTYWNWFPANRSYYLYNTLTVLDLFLFCTN